MDYEAEKLELERQRLALDKHKVELDAKQARWTSLSVAVPVVIAFLTVFYGIYSANQAAKAQFQVEAAKSAMQAKSPTEIAGRIQFYKKIFPQLSADFAPSVEQADVGNAGDDRSVESRIRFFEALAKTREATPRQLVETWRLIFPPDDWASGERLDAIWKPVPQKANTAKGSEP